MKKFNSIMFLIIVLILVLTLSNFFFSGIGNTDIVNHLTGKEEVNLSNLISFDGYPLFIYYLYPNFIFFGCLYSFVFTGFLIYLYSKNIFSDINPLFVYLIYFLSFIPISLVGLGLFKQIIFNLFLVLFLYIITKSFNLLFKIFVSIVSVFILLLLLPVKNLINSLFLYGNVVFISPPLSVFFVLFFSFFALFNFDKGRVIDVVLFSVFFASLFLGIFSQRIFLTSFLIIVPYCALFFQNLFRSIVN